MSQLNTQEVKNVREALPNLLGKPKVTQFKEQGSIRLDLGFVMADGSALSIYAIKRTTKRKISLFSPLKISNADSNTTAIQALLKTYGLIVTQELIVAEETDRPLGQRIAALCQGLIAIDALGRGLEVVKSAN